MKLPIKELAINFVVLFAACMVMWPLIDLVRALLTKTTFTLDILGTIPQAALIAVVFTAIYYFTSKKE